MSIINEIIRLEADNTISFGNYMVAEKQKIQDFDVNGDIYKVRTHNEVTRLSKNTKLLLETVPGATIHNFNVGEKLITFMAEGNGSTQITLELESDTNYTVYVDDVNIGKIDSKMSGKINFSVELTSNPQSVRIEKH